MKEWRWALLLFLATALIFGSGHLQSKEPEPKAIPGYEAITFKALGGYEYDVFDEERVKKGLNRIPDAVKALDGKKVAIRGYMLPMDEFPGRVTKFILLPNTLTCCFGVSPPINQWIEVDMPKGKYTKSYEDEPIVVCGVLRVGEIIRSGEIESLYGMTADSIIPS